MFKIKRIQTCEFERNPKYQCQKIEFKKKRQFITNLKNEIWKIFEQDKKNIILTD